MSEICSETFEVVVHEHREKGIVFDADVSALNTSRTVSPAVQSNCIAVARSIVESLAQTDLTDIGFAAYVPEQGGAHVVATEMYNGKIVTAGFSNNGEIPIRDEWQSGLSDVFCSGTPRVTTAYMQTVNGSFRQLRPTNEGENTRPVLLGGASIADEFFSRYFEDSHPDKWAAMLRAAHTVNELAYSR